MGIQFAADLKGVPPLRHTQDLNRLGVDRILAVATSTYFDAATS
jgi:hypothetical protein